MLAKSRQLANHGDNDTCSFSPKDKGNLFISVIIMCISDCNLFKKH